MINKGYAKPYSKYYCEALTEYQLLKFLAKFGNKGLYNSVATFCRFGLQILWSHLWSQLKSGYDYIITA